MLATCALTVLVPAATVSAEPVEEAVSTFDYTDNMHPQGFSARSVPLDNTLPGQGRFNSDLAFWGKTAAQGTYNGFRLIDVSDPENPVQLVNYEGCVGDQGDVLLWENLLIRSWNSPAGALGMCGGQLVGQGFEGLHIFDISDPANPVLLRGVRMASNTTPTGCGSHTATLVPDVGRGNLYVYNSASSGSCPGIDIVKIPLADPASAVFLRREPSGRSCHDTGVILGDVNLVACAGGNGFTVWSIDPSLDPSAPGGLEDPVQLFSRTISGVSIGHSAAFTWDGEVLIFGHEPGGGGQAQCQATSSTTNRSIFFFDPDDAVDDGTDAGTLLGTFLHPRPQTNRENCTWHNYNVVPSDKRYIMVSGNYQSGVSVVEFTDPANAHEVAYADPAPLPNPNNPAAIELGGDWSTYWYNGRIYESDITRGLIIWKLGDNAVAGAKRFYHLNPQTQMTSFAFKGTAFGSSRAASNQLGATTFGASEPGDASGGGGGQDFAHEHTEDGGL
ncbi:MAG TPA: hypothetical protein VHL78_06230 [Actinomycetota bacterium]|nr:hypothetical protein [Actinomycetota bacterium]